MKYAFIALLLCCCAQHPINTASMTYEEKMLLFDRLRLQYRPVQFYPMPSPQQHIITWISEIMKLILSVLKDAETHSVETPINSLKELEWESASLRILKPLLAVLLDTIRTNETS